MGSLEAAARIGRGTAVTWLLWIAARALALVTLLLLARALPKEDLGSLFAALATGVLGATLAMGGLPDATTRRAASASGTATFGLGDVRKALYRFGATLPLIFVLLVVIAFRAPGSTDVPLVIASLLLALTQGATTIVASVFRARGQAARFAMVTAFIVSAGRAAIAGAALTFDAGAGLVLWTFVALNLALIVGTWRPALRGLPKSSSQAGSDASLHLGGAVWSVLGNLDVVVVGVVVGAEAAGTYGAALRLSEFSYQFLLALSVLHLPEATRLAVAGRRDALGSLYRTTTKWCALVTLLIAGIGFIAAPSLAAILFPDDVSTTTTLIRILLMGYGISGALGLTYNTLMAVGADRVIRRAAIVALPAIVLVTVALTQAFGVVGAACATFSAYVVLSVCWALLVATTVRVTPFDRLYVRAILVCVLSWGVALVVAGLTGSAPAAVSLVATGAAGFATWSAALWLGSVLSAGELELIGRARARLSRA
jgi:O-antigen/teichoic acid export membrane protein